jgi:ribosomal protein S16
LSLDRIEYWVSHGAQVSPTVQRLIRDFADKQKAAAATV